MSSSCRATSSVSAEANLRLSLLIEEQRGQLLNEEEASVIFRDYLCAADKDGYIATIDKLLGEIMANGKRPLPIATLATLRKLLAERREGELPTYEDFAAELARLSQAAEPAPTTPTPVVEHVLPQKPAPVPLAKPPESPPVTSPAPSQPAPKPKTSTPEIKVSLLAVPRLRTRFAYGEGSADTEPTLLAKPAFEIKRLELGTSATLSPQIKASAMIDPSGLAKTEEDKDVQKPILKDAYVSWSIPLADDAPKLTLVLGKTKIPIGLEAYGKGRDLPLVDVAAAESAFAGRSLGLKLSFELPGSRLAFTAGLFNDTSTSSEGVARNLALRIEGSPYQRGEVALTLGSSFYKSIAWEDELPYSVMVAEGFGSLTAGPFKLASDWFYGENRTTAYGPTSKSYGGHVSLGVYAAERVELLGRYGYLDPDLTKDLTPEKMGDADEQHHVDLAVNYTFGQEPKDRGNRFFFGVSHAHKEDGSLSAPSETSVQAGFSVAY